MTIELTRKRICSVLVAGMLGLGGIVFCSAAYWHRNNAADRDLLAQNLRQAGDAPAAVQQGVRVALHAFQEGYSRRDPKDLNAFMSRLFVQSDDILILGTDRSEWVRGYPAAAEFIKADWMGWGDFRFGVDDAIICSVGDVAWVASVGTVHTSAGDRPVRFSAILTRHGNDWHFRQVHFQWEGHPAGPATMLLLRK